MVLFEMGTMIMIKIATASAVLLVCLITGCVSSNFMAVGHETYPPRPDDYVIDVYLPIDAPVAVHKSVPNAKDIKALPGNANVIGRVDTTGAPAANWGAVIADAQRKARQLGGDALVIRQIGSHLTSVDSYGSAMYGKNVSMEVVRFGHASSSGSTHTNSYGAQSYDASGRGTGRSENWLTGRVDD